MKCFPLLCGLAMIALAALTFGATTPLQANETTTVITTTTPALAANCACSLGAPCQCIAQGLACTCSTLSSAPLFSQRTVLSTPYGNSREVIRLRRTVFAVPLTAYQLTGVPAGFTRQKHVQHGRHSVTHTKVRHQIL